MTAILASFPACRQPRRQSAELWLGGDVNLGDGGKGQLQNITGMVQGASGIVNLEGPVSERLETTDRLRLWNTPTALAELSAAQVKVAGIANNHAVDASASGPEQTAKELRDHGILPAGAVAGTAFFEVNGVSIAVTAHDLTRGVPENLEPDLAVARRKSQVLISTFHVTGLPSYLPRPELRRAVEIAYHAGANVIAAQGTHMLGPVERRDHAVIAWGLGNLAFSCDCTQEEDAMLLRVVVEPDKVVRAEVIPLQAGINLKPAQPAGDAAAILDLLDAIGSKGLQRHGSTADF
ncbi:MAG TPA: CapA family protein [Candidatus Angelobacter sp.]